MRPRLRLRAQLAAAAAGLLAVGGGAVLLMADREPAAAAALTVAIPPAKAAALIEATSGRGSMDLQASGDQARLINASLPFATGPVNVAQRFVLAGSETDEQRALLCLTQAVYYEAGSEPLEGRRAVAQVVLNRLRHPAFPKSVCGVVYQGAGTATCQFTFVCDGALYRRPEADAWRQAEQVAHAALSGYVETAVGEATHYHADYVVPRWAPLLAKVAEIGQHIFYRWPGAWGQRAAFTGRYIGEPQDPLALRPAPTPAEMVAANPVDQVQQSDAGPPVARAPDDVGGLLDTSKGWTLHIPGPDESDGAAARVIASQGPTSSAPREIASAATGGPTPGSR